VICTRPVVRSGRRPLAVALVVVLCLAGALAGTAVPALAAKPKHHRPAPQVEILAPKREARVSGKSLTVRLRASTATAFRAAVSGTDVTGRFHRHGKLLEATLRRGRDYQVGENLLSASVGKGRRLPTTVPFVSLTRARGLLKVTKLAAHGTRPLRFRIRAAAPLAGLKVSVDHQRYRVGRVEGKRSWTIAIGASDGAHFGANTLVAAAEREGSKRFDREEVHVRIGRGAPLAGAGADQTTRSGRAVTLRGGSTMAGSKSGALIYRWQIVQKPAGSHARIAHGTKVNASLLPDLPGAYKVKLSAARVSKATAAKERSPKATASSAEAEAAAKPTCLEAAVTPLSPAGGGGNASASASATPGYEPDELNGPLVALSPLEAPPCVTPIGEPTTPSMPLEAARSLSVDVTGITALPTESPMGWPIETITSDGSVVVGSQTFKKQSGWVRMLVLGQESLTPVKPFGKWPKGEKVFSLGEGKALQEAVERSGEEQIVVLTGMGVPQSNPPTSAGQGLAKAIALLGGPSVSSEDQEAIVASGNWSVIGTKGQPGRTFTNLQGLGEQPVEGLPATLPGSLNGYMQSVLTSAFSYVSPEAIPIDTKAEGSSNTLSVIEVGGEKATSSSMANGSLALHIAVFGLDNANGKPTLAANYTDVIDNPNYNTNQPGVEAAAKQLEQWRVTGGNYLIVMQTFGEEAVGPNTAPWGSPNWVNDALIPPNDRGLLEWDKQPYLKAKNEAELEDKQDERWNPGYPTVAGQVGDLTGEVGHDIVSILGGGNPGVEVSRLTMVAENHAESTDSNYIDGYAAPSPGRLNGLLVRNARGGLQVESASAMPLRTVGNPGEAKAVSGPLAPTNSFRETAFFTPSSPWPYATGAENERALAFFAAALWPVEHFKTPREAYVKKSNSDWDQVEGKLKHVKWEAGNGFELHTFGKVKEQLEEEINDMAAVHDAIKTWRKLFGEEGITAFVNAESIGSTLVEQVEHDAKQKPKDEAEINPEEVIEEALYIVGDLSGFPEDTEFLKFPEIISMAASGMGLAESVSPETPEEAEGPNANLIRAKASAIGTILFKHFENVTRSLGHFEEIFASDWGKLQKATEYASGPWTFGEEEEKILGHSLAVNAEQQLYEELLPMAYTQWVIAPYFTRYMPSGPQAPGNNYKCIHFHEGGDEVTVYPFGGEPEGGLSTSIYRPFDPPGATTKPAQPYTVPFTIRALKSDADNLEVVKSEYSETEDLIEIHHGGANPPSSLIGGLFKPVNKGDEPKFPKDLGINKSAFYAGFGEGSTEWKRVICAQG
jgi:hypothetical protein